MSTKYSTYEIRERAVKAVLKGHPITEVASIYSVHRTTLHRWLVRYDEKSESGNLKRKPGSGRPRVMNKSHMTRLYKLILKPASKYGFETELWTCRRLIQVSKKIFKVNVSQPTMWRRLREMGLTYQKPKRKYTQADEKLRKKWITKELPRILEFTKEKRAILYFEDESNISLTAILGKTWAPKGQTPNQEVTGKRGGISAMSAISKRGSLVFTLHEKRIASNEVIHFLQQLLNHHPRRHLVVIMDQARPHTSKKTKDFIKKSKRLHVFYLPPYSPDFNPDEVVWNHLKHQEMKSHKAQTKKELKKLSRRKLKNMSKDPRLLRGLFFRCYVADFMN
jgi:transposase